MKLATGWKDYELLDCGDGEKLERWGDWLLSRPDPQAIWPRAVPARWQEAHAHYERSGEGGGQWHWRAKLPEEWQVRHRDLSFIVRPTDFKHTGLFPEQAVNWEWMQGAIRKAGRPVAVLNLFAYTGAATVACVAAGAEVCHVDAAKGMVRWAERNLATNGLRERPLRLIVDDVTAFVRREARRGRLYDAIIMDPPTYGRGSTGEMWRLEDHLWPLLCECREVLSESPLFFLVNAYTARLSPTVVANLLAELLGSRGGEITAGEVGLPVQVDGKVLPCGIYGRWEA